MTIYTHIDSNIRKTYLLMAGFGLFIVFLGWFFSRLLGSNVFLILAIIIAFFQGFLSYWYSDKIVLALTHAKPIEKKDNPELYRIVENLAITAGLPTPKIYILEESQPNAFATGRDPKHSVIAVTRGLLEKLEKSELEGVIAHEFSHIGNRDMLLATIAVILAGVIALICQWFFRLNLLGFGRRRRGSGRGDSGILLIIGLIVALLAPLAAALIKLAVSRKREFLADASGALLTRYPEGLARALEKISSDRTPLRVANTATSHLFISSPFKGEEKSQWFLKLFMTHPPVEERIKALRSGVANS